jgi:hypothetical protein
LLDEPPSGGVSWRLEELEQQHEISVAYLHVDPQ